MASVTWNSQQHFSPTSPQRLTFRGRSYSSCVNRLTSEKEKPVDVKATLMLSNRLSAREFVMEP